METKNKYCAEVYNQNKTLSGLKKFREQMEAIRRDINNTNQETEIIKLKEKYHEAMERYKKLRFKDTRKYSEDMQVWKTKFIEYVELKGLKNPSRIAKMACDVILTTESKDGEHLFQKSCKR